MICLATSISDLFVEADLTEEDLPKVWRIDEVASMRQTLKDRIVALKNLYAASGDDDAQMTHV